MLRWNPDTKGRYESECGRFLVFAEGRDWIGVDLTGKFDQSPGFHLPDAARAWCEARAGEHDATGSLHRRPA